MEECCKCQEVQAVEGVAQGFCGSRGQWLCEVPASWCPRQVPVVPVDCEMVQWACPLPQVAGGACHRGACAGPLS